MAVKIALRLAGLDLRDVAAYERIPEELAELSFQANGDVSVAVLYAASPPVAAAAEAADWARLISKLIPGAQVIGAHEELVSVSDIAARCHVAPEAVRLWATGKRRNTLRPFPAAREVVGSNSGRKSMRIYSWPEVAGWVREVIGLDPDSGITYLDARQHAHLNAELTDAAAASHSLSEGWRSITTANKRLTATVSCHPRAPSAMVAANNAFNLIARMDGLLIDNDVARGRRVAYQ